MTVLEQQEQIQEPVTQFYELRRTVPSSGSIMQLHDTATGPELEMNSALAYPSWTTSTKPCPCNVPNGKHNYWCPPDAFHCTFCPRVFRTAQALGGHMNIHRRQRACANENGACYHTHPGNDSQPINSMLFRPSSSLPAPLVAPHGSSLFFGGNSQQLPIDLSQSSPAVRNFVENCYANRNIAAAPDAPRHLATTSAPNFFTPMQAAGDMTNHRVGRNRGDGATSTDPLSWLFSQLPPPGSITALQRQQQLQQQQQQHQHQQYRATNVLFQNNLVARPSAPRPSAPYADDTPQARVRPRPVVAMGGRHGEQEGAQEGLDLELRL